MPNVINNIVKNDTTYAIQDARVDDLTSVFFVDYNVTSWDDIKSHYDAHEDIIVKYTAGSAVEYFELNEFNSNVFVFQRISNYGSSSALNIGFERITVSKNGTQTVYEKDSNLVQKKLTAGENITIENNVISATGGGSTYEAGTGIKIVDDEISTVYQDVNISALEFSQEGEIHNDDFGVNEGQPEGHRAYIDFDYAYPEGGDPLFSTEIAKAFVDKWKEVGDDYKNAVINLKCTFSNGVTYEDDIPAFDGGSGWSDAENNEYMTFATTGEGVLAAFTISYRAAISSVRCCITYRQLDENVFNSNVYLASVEVTDNYESHEASDTINPEYIPVTADITKDNSGVKTIYGGALHSAEQVGTYSGTVFSSGRMEIYDSQIPTLVAQKTLLPGYFNPNIIFDVRVHFDGVADDLIINADTVSQYNHSCILDIYQGEIQNFYYYSSANSDFGENSVTMNVNGGNAVLSLRAEDFVSAHSIEDGTPFTITVNDFDWNTPINASFIPVSSTFKVENGLIDLEIDGSSETGLFAEKNADGGYRVYNNLDLGTLKTNGKYQLSTVIGGGQSGVIFNNDTLTYVGEYSGEDHPQYEYDIEASAEELKNIFNPSNWHVKYDGEEFNMFYLQFEIVNQIGAVAELNYTHTDTADGYIDNFKDYWMELTHTVENGESTYSAKFYFNSQDADNLEIFGECRLDSSKYITYSTTIGAQYVPVDDNAIKVNDDGKLTIATVPSSDGNYVLKCTVVDGAPTFTWVSES